MSRYVLGVNIDLVVDSDEQEEREMKIGERLNLDGTLSDENMSFLKQLGVDYLMVVVSRMAGYPERLPIVSKLRTGDTEYGHRGRAFAIGYMKGLAQAVFDEA